MTEDLFSHAQAPLVRRAPSLEEIIGAAVYRKIRLESYSFGDAYNEEAHQLGIYRSENRLRYDALKESARIYCDARDPWLTLHAWAHPRDNHKCQEQKYPLAHRTRLKPGIETEA